MNSVQSGKRSAASQHVPRARGEHQPRRVVEEHLRIERESCGDTDEQHGSPSTPRDRDPAEEQHASELHRSHPGRRVRVATPKRCSTDADETMIGGLIASSVPESPARRAPTRPPRSRGPWRSRPDARDHSSRAPEGGGGGPRASPRSRCRAARPGAPGAESPPPRARRYPRRARGRRRGGRR